jgi:hypothetical protein
MQTSCKPHCAVITRLFFSQANLCGGECDRYAGYAMDTLAVVLAVLPVLRRICVGHLVPIAQAQFLQGPKAQLRR